MPKFRYSLDTGANWVVVDAALPFSIPSAAGQTVMVEPIGSVSVVAPVLVSLSALSLSANTVVENSTEGVVIGGILNRASGSTLSIVDTAGTRFNITGSNVVAGNTATNFESNTSHQITVRETLAGAVNSPRDTVLTINVSNVLEQPNLVALTLGSTVNVGTTIPITGATAGSTITGSMPTGWTLNGAARTITIAANAPVGSQSWSLTESLADSANSPRVSSGSSTVSSEPTITIAAPTWSDDFNAYADGTRLVAGDPNANAGLVATNPGNLGWDALTSLAPTTARFDPVIFQGVVRRRTTGGNGDFIAPGTYVLAPAGTQTGPLYAQMTVEGISENGQNPTLNVFASDQANRLGLQVTTSTANAGTVALSLVSAGTTTAPASFASFGTKLRMGGTNGQFVPWRASETLTMLCVNNTAYVRRGPGFPVGSTAGTAVTFPGGNRFGFSTHAGVRANRIDAARVGPAPMFITVNETHRFWVPKRRASASDPITAGVGDETFTGTYIGTIPSRMQWALFNLGTGTVIKDWATVPTADFTASGGTWSARLRSIPVGLNGRGAYAVGFRPVNASDQTDPAWQVVSNREFYVTLNVGCIGQSNAAFLGQNVTGTAYPRVDGLATYTKADPPSVVQGDYTPRPRFWSDTVTFGAAACTHVLADYLANLYNLPVSCEILAIAANGALTLGPNGANWSYIQTHHAFAGGAYDVLYLSQGENEFVSNPELWLSRWRDENLPAYRDPAMSGQPAGTVIPLLYTITGRFTGTPGGTDANAQTLRVAQYQLESQVSDCYLAHSYTGVEMVDTFHYVTTNGEGYNEAMRRARLTYGKVFNAEAYDGRGPIATSVSRSGAVLTVTFDLNGASSLTTRDGRDQTLTGTASALTSWQVSADNFATTLAVTSAVQTGNTVVITLAADPGGPVRVRNHFGLNPDLTNWVSGSYADGTFIGMMPLVNSLLSN